jgi:lysophospholipase L1-like esterase
MDPLGISYYEAMDRYNREVKIPDPIPELIYRQRPSYHGSFGGIEVSTNEFGLRDEPIPPKRPSEFRILILGDSVTFGWGVPQDQTYPAQLQKNLKKYPKNFRVINAGVSGYNTVQEYAYLNNGGLSLRPDLILLMYTSNDIEHYRGPLDSDASSLRRKTKGEVISVLGGMSWLYRLAVHAYYLRWVWSIEERYESASKTVGWSDSMKALREFAELSETRQIPGVIFFWRWHSTGAPFSDALLADVKKTAAPLPTVDVGEWFSRKSTDAYFNSTVDTHPNAEGHEILAENIELFLLDNDSLLAAAQP